MVMAPDLKLLIPEFHEKIARVISLCREQGIEMRPFCTVRNPLEQARLWRQSRTKEEISIKIAELNKKGADFLAYCLESAGPQNGRHATNALPGFSWHQWGEAVDCMWIVETRAEWSVQKKLGGNNGYRLYAETAVREGLTPGGFWKKFKDWPHVQLRPAASPSKIMSIAEIDAEMKKRFGADTQTYYTPASNK
jgi:peptidoglycan LD-endopeptidase CwlK